MELASLDYKYVNPNLQYHSSLYNKLSNELNNNQLISQILISKTDEELIVMKKNFKGSLEKTAAQKV
ncbi:hypothetical protein [Halobacteriovorax sp. HLS]|uniref:hypothetical protein n=1 Tax=Halobacteriovorax sp. HLS TaxID=2234000 RepID=UPI000FD9A618|nr:hypothetical protein [Halobacteriovorax sp. HLS]